MEKSFGWTKDKLRYEARKRDRLRSKMRPGLRLRALDDAEAVVQQHEKVQTQRDKHHEREDKAQAFDNAMNTVIKGMRKTAEIKQLVL